ncbi:MAG TPA: hypothetical protein DCL44_09160 [Elusimicrobia bacterium]|nr:hypothetical protein [Elusimicrobiota bacterium]
MKKKKGQILVGVIVLLVVLAILVPVMVNYVQNEAKWSVKESQNTNAFQLAESSVDRAYQKIVESTATWAALQSGEQLTGYMFDTVYSDLAGGTYTISITSGPLTQQATIIGIGRDKQNKEVRALKVVYGNSVLSDTSIAAANGVLMSGNGIQVEWGAIASPKEVNMYDKTHPSFWSAAGIKNGSHASDYADTNGATPPNCDSPDCWWWHSYNTTLPPMPTINFEAYKSSAIAAGNDPCGRAYYQAGNFSSNCTSTANPGKTYYIEGNWTGFNSAIIGNVIVRGNLTYSNGAQPSVHEHAVVPPTAWKQYCNDWDYYRSEFDSTPAADPPCLGGLSDSYRVSGVTYAIDAGIHGFVYVGGDFTIPNGGGSSDLIHGAIVVNGTANIDCNSSDCRIYYDPDVASNIMTTTVNLTRQSWQDSSRSWPSTLP